MPSRGSNSKWNISTRTRKCQCNRSTVHSMARNKKEQCMRYRTNAKEIQIDICYLSRCQSTKVNARIHFILKVAVLNIKRHKKTDKNSFFNQMKCVHKYYNNYSINMKTLFSMYFLFMCGRLNYLNIYKRAMYNIHNISAVITNVRHRDRDAHRSSSAR